MAEKLTGTVGTVWNIAQPLAEELGLILWDVRFQKEGAEWYLRIFIDKQDGGIGIEDYNDIKIGDVIECFVMEEIER